MTSTKRTTRRRRTSQFIATTTCSIGLAIATAVVAHAEWDIEAYDKCMAKTIRNPIECCLESGGVIGNGVNRCVAPHAFENDAMTGQPAPPRSPEEIVGGPVRDFNVPDANVPDAPVIVLPTP